MSLIVHMRFTNTLLQNIHWIVLILTGTLSFKARGAVQLAEKRIKRPDDFTPFCLHLARITI